MPQLHSYTGLPPSSPPMQSKPASARHTQGDVPLCASPATSATPAAPVSSAAVGSSPLDDSAQALFAQANVHIRTSPSPESDIAGELSLVKPSETSPVRLLWKPYGPGVSTARVECYAFSVVLSDIYALKRYIPPIGYSVLSLVCKDGVCHPPLFFHDGGVRNFLAFMNQFVDVTKSRTDSNLFLINQSASVLTRPEFFAANDSFLSTIKEASWTFVERLSRVTGLGWEGDFYKRPKSAQQQQQQQPDTGVDYEVLLPYGASPSSVKKPTPALLSTSVSTARAAQSVLECRQEADTDLGVFEILSSNTTLPVPDAKRNQPLSAKEWQSYFDDEGRIHDVTGVRRAIFSGGVEPAIRKEVWKYLFGFYPFGSTRDERALIEKQKADEYYSIKSQWTTITPLQESRFSKFRERKSRIDKDVVRTDRQHSAFKDDNSPYLTVLRELLLTYTFYSFDVGYVQGMSDLLSPILFVLDDEVHAFWCFAGMMETMEGNFHRDQHGMHGHLKRLASLTKFMLPPLHKFLESRDGTNFFFAFRWLIIAFKREFAFDDVLTLWEVLWSSHLSFHFEQFFALAILDLHKGAIMDANMEFDDILKYINDLSMQLNLQSLLQRAEVLFYTFAQQPTIPKELEDLLQPFRPAV